MVDETLVSAQGDSGGVFRQIDGKYLYNLNTASFTPSSAPGVFLVHSQIDGVTVGTGKVTLKEKARGPERGPGLRVAGPRRKSPNGP